MIKLFKLIDKCKFKEINLKKINKLYVNDKII